MGIAATDLDVVYKLLHDLFDNWHWWNENRDYYLDTLFSSMITGKYIGTPQEMNIISKLKAVTTSEDYHRLVDIAKDMEKYEAKKRNEREVEAIIKEITDLASRFEFEEAEKIYQKYKERIPYTRYQNILSEAKTKFEFAQQIKREREKEQILNEIIDLASRFEFEAAEKFYQKHKEKLPSDRYQSIINEAKTKFEFAQQIKREREKEQILKKINDLASRFEFEAAEKFYQINKERIPSDRYQTIIDEAKIKFEIKKIEEHLRNYQFDLASELFLKISPAYDKDTFNYKLNFFKREQSKKIFVTALKDKLLHDKFSEADQMFFSTDLVNLDEYLPIKKDFLSKYLSRKYKFKVNRQQLEALANCGSTILVKARAGSGKTSLLSLKTVLLLDGNVPSDNILLIAFNKAASNEILSRIKNNFGKHHFRTVKTFHALAHGIVKPDQKLLYDDPSSIHTRGLSKFIQSIIKDEIKNPAFVELLFEHFRAEMTEIENAGYLLDKENYAAYRREMIQVTLNGERVKSKGEKYIADYLFEHGIPYVYEQPWFWKNEIYRPDFSIYINQKDLVIEHWGIDENDSEKKISPNWNQKWDDYFQQMQRKRDYWKQQPEVIFIQTSVSNLRGTREDFEKFLDGQFKKNGVWHPKLPDTELIQKIINSDHIIARMTLLFAQFIQKAKKNRLNVDSIQSILDAYESKNERERIFIDLAIRIFQEYEKKKSEQGLLDFDDLLFLAIKLIKSSKGECTFAVGAQKERKIKLVDLRWILIDEFQDMSPLFYEMINTIKNYNPNLNLYCVGDDWQAINVFAGSDLKYFLRFSDWFGHSVITHLQTNYRSESRIIEAGNRFMEKYGEPAFSLPEKKGGEISICYLDDVWVEARNNLSTGIPNKKDSLLSQKGHQNFDYSGLSITAKKYVKLCSNIIKNQSKPNQSVGVISRTNIIEGLTLAKFQSALFSYLGERNQNITVQTAHRFKGLEADIIIILNVVDSSFPLLHPDNYLFGLFGDNMKEALESEMRLFYVAITRAKRKLFLITEKQNQSIFLNTIRPYTSNYKFLDQRSKNSAL